MLAKLSFCYQNVNTAWEYACISWEYLFPTLHHLTAWEYVLNRLRIYEVIEVGWSGLKFLKRGEVIRRTASILRAYSEAGLRYSGAVWSGLKWIEYILKRLKLFWSRLKLFWSYFNKNFITRVSFRNYFNNNFIIKRVTHHFFLEN